MFGESPILDFMKCNLHSLILSLSFLISAYQLSAQNASPPVNPASPAASSLPGSFASYTGTAIATLNDGKRNINRNRTGLQSYSNLKGWQNLSAPGVTDWNHLTIGKTGIGGFFMYSNTNTATGTDALRANTTGTQNVADGYDAMESNTTGIDNVGVGYSALSLNSSGGGNTAVGFFTMGLGGGSGQTAVGSQALWYNGGTENVAVGSGAILYDASGSYNTAVGANSLEGFIDQNSESYSVAVGYQALETSISSTGYNCATGYNSITANTSGYYNTANGALTMVSNSTGSANAAFGTGALYSSTSGTNNVGIGYLALYSNTIGSQNTSLGYFANVTSGDLSNSMALGANATVNASNKVVIGSTSVTSIGGYAGWSNFSDGRYKKNIQQNIPGLAFINKLNPITYTLDINGIENKLHENQKPVANKNLAASAGYQNDPIVKQSMQEKSAITYSGFVAQDVEKAADSLGYNFSGVDKPNDANQSFYGLRYGDFVVPLVKAVQELSASSDKKDSVINSLEGKVDSLQTQINEIRSMLLLKNQFSGSAIPGASLDQNVPNPTSNSTTIGYALPQGTESAQMQITDMSGKILQIISLSGVGRNTITVDTSSLQSGTYSYSLLINGQLAGTRKMVSVR
jgi:hypothetical protein